MNSTVAFRTTDGGEIRDGHTGTDLIGGSALLIAGDGIGSSSDPLDLKVNRLEGDAGLGLLAMNRVAGRPMHSLVEQRGGKTSLDVW